MKCSTRNVCKFACNVAVLAAIQHLMHGHTEMQLCITTVLALVGAIGAGVAGAAGAVGGAVAGGVGAAAGAVGSAAAGVGSAIGSAAGTVGSALGSAGSAIGSGISSIGGSLGIGGGAAGGAAPSTLGTGLIGSTSLTGVSGAAPTLGTGLIGSTALTGVGGAAPTLGTGLIGSTALTGIGGAGAGATGSSSLLSSGLGLLGKVVGGRGGGGGGGGSGGGGGGGGGGTGQETQALIGPPNQTRGSPWAAVPPPAQQQAQANTGGYGGILSQLTGPSGSQTGDQGPGFLSRLILGPDASKLSPDERSSALWEAGLSALGSGLRYAGANRPNQRGPFTQTGGPNLLEAGRAQTADVLQGQRQDRADRYRDFQMAWQANAPARAAEQHLTNRQIDVANPLAPRSAPRAQHLETSGPQGYGDYVLNADGTLGNFIGGGKPAQPRAPARGSDQAHAISIIQKGDAASPDEKSWLAGYYDLHKRNASNQAAALDAYFKARGFGPPGQ